MSQEASSDENVNVPLGIPLMTEAKKSKKDVTEYYKKQNELLENFKTDSEQILVSSKARTKQRRQSASSVDDNEKKDGDDSILTLNSSQQPVPLLTYVDDEESENRATSYTSSSRLTPGSLSRRRKGSYMNRSHESAIARHEAAMNEEIATTKSATRFAFITLFLNLSLLLAKGVASYLSGSLSIISSLVDSCVDITSGLVIAISTRMIERRDPYLYPRGRTRLQPLSLIIISVVMGVASIQLIFESILRIIKACKYDFATKEEQAKLEAPKLEVDIYTICIMVATVFVKLILFWICKKFKHDPSIKVLAMDHRNDCLSNTVALACAWLADKYWYYLDPIGAILVSIYILSTWVSTGREHMTKLSGRSAKSEFINRIIKVCIDHDQRITHLDTVYVYHFGTKFLVEVHIVMDENMILRVAHDISEALQINIESLPEVERAFVHADYEFEHQPRDEHKIV